MAELIYLPVDRLHPHPDNPRKDLGDLSELADSIKANGIFQNLTVVPNGEDYTVIIGHRRLSAAKLAGLETVPCVVADMSPKEQLSTMLLENMQRTDLTVYEQAQGFQMMLDLGSTVEEIAEKSGFSTTTVRRRVKMMELDQEKLKEVSDRQLSLGDFDRLAQIENIAERNKVLGDIGTADFNRSLEWAMNRQKTEKNLPAVKKWLKDNKAKKISQSESWSTKYESVKSYIYIADWLIDKAHTPENPGCDLFYVLTDTHLSLYKRRERQKGPKKSKAELEREHRIKAAWARIEEEASLAYDLRSKFVDELTVTNKNRDIILRGAVLSHLMETIDYNSPDRNRIMGLLGVPEKPGYYSERLKQAVDGYNKLPEKDLPKLILVLMGDSAKMACTGTSYKGEFPKYTLNIRLNVIYDWLASLGYEISTDEMAMLNGEHEMYKEGGADG